MNFFAALKPEEFVRLMAGTMLVISLAITVFVTPWGLLLTAFVAVNLIQSALTGFCPGVIIFTAFIRKTISPLEAAQLAANGKAIIIDVRDPEECADGHAAPAHRLPLSDLQGKRDTWNQVLAQHPDAQVICYCQSGLRSALAARLLRAEGRKAISLGSFNAWQSAQLPVDKA